MKDFKGVMESLITQILRKYRESMEDFDFNRPLVVFLYGLPGSGKGTQARLLAEKSGFFVWDNGAILRAERDFVLADGKRVGEMIDRGILLADQELFEVIDRRLSLIDSNTGIIFDGLPRRVSQAEFLLDRLRKLGFSNFICILIKLPREESIKRLVLRAKQEARIDDTPEVIAFRLRQTEELMESVLSYLQTQMPLFTVDGAPAIPAVAKSIEKIFKAAASQKHIITIAGLPGSGKSSTSKEVARRLGYEHFSSGDLFRKMAGERGLSVTELNLAAETRTKIDRQVDDLLLKIGKEKDYLVIDSRTAFHWIPSSFKVFLDLDPLTAAKRTFAHIQKEGRVSQAGSSIEEVMGNTSKRIASEKKRYQNLYGIDFTDKKNFDLVIDTKDNDLEQAVRQVVAKYNEWLSARING